MTTRAALLGQLYQAVKTGVDCVDRLNGGKLDLIERAEAKAQMATAWVEMRRVLAELAGVRGG